MVGGLGDDGLSEVGAESIEGSLGEGQIGAEYESWLGGVVGWGEFGAGVVDEPVEPLYERTVVASCLVGDPQFGGDVVDVDRLAEVVAKDFLDTGRGGRGEGCCQQWCQGAGYGDRVDSDGERFSGLDGDCCEWVGSVAVEACCWSEAGSFVAAGKAM